MQYYHIAFCANAAYVPYALITMHSIMVHHQLDNNEAFHFHLLTEQEVDGRKDVQDFLRTYHNVRLTTHLIDTQQYKQFDHPVFTLWTNLRANLPLLLGDVDRVLYLDTDVLVVGDLRPLFTLDLQGKYMAMAEEIFLRNRTDFTLPHYLTLPVYNAGVALMDLEQLRKIDFTQQFWEKLSAQYHQLHSPDQDIINITWKEHIYPLPQIYNVHRLFLTRPETYIPQYKEELKECLWAPVIIHYALSAPWFLDRDKHPYHQHWIDFNKSLKYPAPITYGTKNKWLRLKMWVKHRLFPNTKPTPIPLETLRQRWAAIPDA
jgi:lipopolysaccharide 1,2-glucosyltransferase/general stress protein